MPKTRKRYSLNEVHKLISISGNCMISKEFEGVNKYLLLKCSKCHKQWSASLRQIQNNRSCPYCSGYRKTINNVREIGNEKGFDLISHKYKSMDAKYKWECQDGHIFCRSANHMKRSGSKCPQCYFFLTEEKCRFIFESLTKNKFPKTRKILKGLELDGYCEKLKLAFEYNGRQHYDKHSLFANDFDGIQRRDKIKLMRCENLNIKLIIIPYTESKKLKNFITSKLKMFEISCTGFIDWNKFKKYQPNKMEHLTKILSEQNIQCLSQTYLGCDTKIELECLKCGKMWKNSPEVLLRGVGCPHCRHRMWTTKQAHEFCRNKRITLLNDDYTTKAKKYSFQCNQCDHTWSTTMSSTTKHGCPKCSTQHRLRHLSKNVLLSIEKRVAKHELSKTTARPKTLRYSVREVKEICCNIGWMFLNKHYQNKDTEYRFKCCKCRKISTVTFRSIKNGTSCPKCK